VRATGLRRAFVRRTHRSVFGRFGPVVASSRSLLALPLWGNPLSAIALALIGCFHGRRSDTPCPDSRDVVPALQRHPHRQQRRRPTTSIARRARCTLHRCGFPARRWSGSWQHRELVQPGDSPGSGTFPDSSGMVADGGVLTLASSLNDAGATIQGLPHCIPRRIWRAVAFGGSVALTCLTAGRYDSSIPTNSTDSRSNVFSRGGRI